MPLQNRTCQVPCDLQFNARFHFISHCFRHSNWLMGSSSLGIDSDEIADNFTIYDGKFESHASAMIVQFNCIASSLRRVCVETANERMRIWSRTNVRMRGLSAQFIYASIVNQINTIVESACHTRRRTCAEHI